MAQASPALLVRLGVEADAFIAMASTFPQTKGHPLSLGFVPLDSL